MHTCRICKKDKDASDFHKKGTDGVQDTCKLCRKEEDRGRYQKNPERRKRLAQAWLDKFMAWCDSFKTNKPCTDCGVIYHPCIMQWDHLNGELKSRNVSCIRSHGGGQKQFLKEIAKCELVCANCHALRTFNRRVAQ